VLLVLLVGLCYCVCAWVADDKGAQEVVCVVFGHTCGSTVKAVVLVLEVAQTIVIGSGSVGLHRAARDGVGTYNQAHTTQCCHGQGLWS
jgi:hypothetical protein